MKAKHKHPSAARKLKPIPEEPESTTKGWIDQFGELRIQLDMHEADSDSWAGKHLRRTGAYKEVRTR